MIYGDGGKVRDYIYISDVARANVAALEKGDGEIFNIASGVPTTDQEVFDLTCRLLGQETLKPRYLAKRPGEIDAICLDVSKAARVLGWKPQVTLAEGARETVAYFKEAAAAAVEG